MVAPAVVVLGHRDRLGIHPAGGLKVGVAAFSDPPGSKVGAQVGDVILGWTIHSGCPCSCPRRRSSRWFPGRRPACARGWLRWRHRFRPPARRCRDRSDRRR